MATSVQMGMEIFGALLRAREEKKIPQTCVAAFMGITREQFSRIENGHRECTSAQLFRWAEALEIELCAQSVTQGAGA